jgi:hypothetical protein
MNFKMDKINIETTLDLEKYYESLKTITFENIIVNKNLTVNGVFTTVNTRSITPIVYNPIEKDVELSKFILEQFKTYDLLIENLMKRIVELENKIQE